tara:strand:+ start:952 stop:1128 length:177 start_codon:yes stop_codon:yes gene_type:complete
MIIGLQEPRQLIIWSLLVVEVVEQQTLEVVLIMLVVVELEVIVHQVMAQVHFKDQIKN